MLAPRTALEEGQEYGRCLLRLIVLCGQYFRQDLALRKVRFYVRVTGVWLDFGNALTGVCAKAQDLEQLTKEVKLFFESPQEMSQRTDLRQ
jgi:hypothetical protein